MNFLRQHWFDIGLVLAAIVGVYLIASETKGIALLLWLNLLFLFLHQFEEYRHPGYFPGMLNTVMFASKQPDRSTEQCGIQRYGPGGKPGSVHPEKG